MVRRGDEVFDRRYEDDDSPWADDDEDGEIAPKYLLLSRLEDGDEQ
jgi:hypothetical protein